MAERERRNAELLEQVLQGIEHLKRVHQPVTQRALSKMLEIPPIVLRRHPHIVPLLQQQKRQHSCDQERELLSQVEAARAQIEREGKPLTQAALVALVGVSKKVLRKFPRIRTLLDEVALHGRRQRLAQRSACEEEYLAKIAAAAAQLSASPEPPTRKALCQAAGVPLSCVYGFPRVKASVKAYTLT